MPHRRTGKVARLSARHRHRLNRMIRDGIPYKLIISKLGKPGKALIPNNLSEWKKGGYIDWLDRQERLEAPAAKLLCASDFVRHHPNANIHEASLQIAVSQIFDLLLRLDPAQLQSLVQADPQSFIRLLNTLPRLTRGGLQCLRQRLKLADRKAHLKSSRSTKKGGLTSETLRRIEDKFHLFSEPDSASDNNANGHHEKNT
jgi:hypothetical protein